MTTEEETYRQYAIEEYTVDREPYYVPVKDEIELFEAAYTQKIPVLLKGPTGCGKTRFIEYMAFKLGRPLTVVKEGQKAAASANGHGRPQRHSRGTGPRTHPEGPDGERRTRPPLGCRDRHQRDDGRDGRARERGLDSHAKARGGPPVGRSLTARTRV